MTRLPDAQLADLLAAIGDEPVRCLFTEPFLRATEIFDELVDAACWDLLDTLGGLGGSVAPAELAERRGASPRSLGHLRFLFAKLAESGLLASADGRYTPAAARPPAVTALAAELREREPAAAVGAEIVELLVAEAPAFFRGEKTGEEILFSPIRLPLWFRYFSNANILYSINNTLGAEALARALPAEGAEILEVGGGCGSAAELALARLGSRAARYRFTELVPTFGRRGERAARAAAAPGTAVEGGRLDMTKPWREQGIEPGRYDAVYSVNCFHVAPDLDPVLREARTALKPGGVVIVSECLRASAAIARPVYPEFIFGFLDSFTNVTLHPERRPIHGFLSPAAWRASLLAAGFRSVEVLPDVDAVAARYPNFIVGAVLARA